MPATVTLHRVLPVVPDKIYRAFITPEAFAAWLPPYGFTCKVHEMDPVVGGRHRLSFTNFTTGASHSFGGVYRALIPGERVQYSDAFDDPALTGELLTTVDMRATALGTDLTIVQEGVPDMIPIEACYLGWQDSLDKLARLVTPNITD